MVTVSEQLRRAREQQQLDIYQVAEITKIKTDHIRALESGNFDMFSAPVYIRGFVRTYAALLKLDVPQIIAALDEELRQTEKFREPPPLSEERSTALDVLLRQFSKINWRQGLIAFGVATLLVSLLVVFLVWRHHRSADPLAGLGPGLYQPTQNVSGELLPLP